MLQALLLELGRALVVLLLRRPTLSSREQLCRALRSISRRSGGSVYSATRSLAAASSIRSMALSGRWRSVT